MRKIKSILEIKFTSGCNENLVIVQIAIESNDA